MYATKTRRVAREHGIAVRPPRFQTLLVIAAGATVLWAILRTIASFFNFTPYGTYVFSRPLLGMASEGTRTGAILGVIVLFLLVALATVLYDALFARYRQWWGGVLYGFALFLLYGQILEMWRWNANTTSTELAWFLSLGLFLGISLTAERYDEL